MLDSFPSEGCFLKLGLQIEFLLFIVINKHTVPPFLISEK